MSAHKIVSYEVFCDLRLTDECERKYESLRTESLTNARAQAKRAGWEYRRSLLTGNKSQDICPVCLRRLRNGHEDDE